MTNIRHLPVPLCYLAMLAALQAVNWLTGKQPGSKPLPDMAWMPATSAIHAGLNHDRLGRSVQRLPTVRFLRMLGNNFRILLGQRLEWIVWGEQSALPVLVPKNELGITRGLGDAGIKANLDNLIRRFGQYSAKLRSEGWELYVVPVPAKLSIYREYFPWPLLDTDQMSRQPVDRDRGEELMAYLARELSARDVHFIDLQTAFRKAASDHPDQWIYPPGESHWSGRGLELAARCTAEGISRGSKIGYVDRPLVTSLPYVHTGDIIRSMDAFPSLLGKYQPITAFAEDLKRLPVYIPAADNQGAADASLVVVLGTSYTGHYGWLVGEPVGFAPAVGAHLENAVVRQISQTGIGGYHPFRMFLQQKEDLARDFQQLTGQAADRARKLVVWEFPIRDFGYLTADSEATINRIENPYGLETHLGRRLFWLGVEPAMLSIFATEDGTLELTADLQPGPAYRPGAACTLLATDEAGIEYRHPVIPGTNRFRLPVKAGTNRWSWRPAEAPGLFPPYGNGDNRILMISVFDLQLAYQPGAAP